MQTVLKDGIFLQRWNFYAIIADRRQMSHDNTSAEKTANGANHNNNNTDQKKKKTSKVNSSVQAALQANHIKVLVQY